MGNLSVELEKVIADARAASEAARPPEEDPAIAKQRAERDLRAKRRTRLLEAGFRNSADAEDAIVAARLKPTAALRAVQGWVKRIGEHEAAPRAVPSPHRIIVLAGGYGSGKTVAAGWAVAELGGRVVHAKELVMRVDPWGDEDKRYDFVSTNTRFVVIDDLGCLVQESGRFVDAFCGFIDARQGRGWTLITTNLPRSELNARYGERIRERLDHVGIQFEVTAPSMRRQAGGTP